MVTFGTTELLTSRPPASSDPIFGPKVTLAPGRYDSALLWMWALVLFSIAWPRYGFFALGGPLKATPFTLISLVSWVALPSILLSSDPIRRLMGHSVRNVSWILSILLMWTSWRYLTAILGEEATYSLTTVSRELIYLYPILISCLIVASMGGGLPSMVRVVVISTAIVMLLGLAELATRKTFPQIFGFNFVSDQFSTREIRLRGSSIRTQSVFYHPIVYGQYLAWATPLLIWSALRENSRIIRLFSLACLIALPIAVLSTGSRAGLLGVGVSAIAFAVLAAVRRTGAQSIAIIAGLASIVLLGSAIASDSDTLVGRLIAGRNSAEAESTRWRNEMVQSGLAEAAFSPVVGYGDGRSPFHAGGFRGPNGAATIDSTYLSSILDSGWVGLFFLVTTWGSIIAAALINVSGRNGLLIDAAIGAGVLALAMTFSIVSITDNYSLFFISIAMISGSRAIANRVNTK